ncbi:MAG: DUF4832 domain-containing protein [Gemmataceae bacterium]
MNVNRAGLPIVLVLASGGVLRADEAGRRVTVKPAETGAALINPEMGWTMHFYSNRETNYGSKLAPSDTLDWFPGCSTVYLRLPWAYIEPEEGKFNWAILDTPAQRWIAKGKTVAFRISCSESWLRYATPEWVKKAGARGVDFAMGKGPTTGGPLWDPDFGDPVFLAKLDRFLAAMAARYDGNPNVAFIDIGSYGMWGEGHTMMSSRVPAEKADPIVRRHIDLHVKHFKKTRLCISDDVAGPNKPGREFPLMRYAISKGVTLRDDSILVEPPPRSWYHAEMAQAFWPTMPVILEHEHFGPSQQRKAWDARLLIKSVEDYHASYLSIHWWPEELLKENRAAIEAINRRLGYRLQLREISWPESVPIGQPFTVEARWANAGVAPCYPGGFVTLTLKDREGGIVAVLADEAFNVRSLEVGPPDRAPVRAIRCELCAGKIAPTTAPGTYDVYVSIGRRDGTPVVALPLPHGDGQRRYRIGTIALKEK